jgi:6-pyruvoyltetrahydropterin/6-carboxytetrahydropterin synthase
MYTITRRYHFEAAHFLPFVRDGHKCKRMHGHNYEFEVTIQSTALVDGFVIDFWELDALVKPHIDMVDHITLNDIAGLENPTAENIAAWLLDGLRTRIGNSVKKVQVWETKDCSAIAE